MIAPDPLPTSAGALAASAVTVPGSAILPTPAAAAEPLELRPELVAVLDAALEGFASGRPLGIALVGTRGSGKTAVLDAIEARLPPDLARDRIALDARVRTEGELVERLREGLRLTGDRLDDLADAIAKGPRRLLLVDDAHRLVLRTVAGCDVLDAFLAFARRTGQKLGWIASTRAEAWTWMDLRFGAAGPLPTRLPAALPGPGPLRQVLEGPMKEAGVRLSFLKRDGSRGDKQAELAADYFDDLHGAVGGSPLGAWIHWTVGLVPGQEAGRVRVAPLQAPSLDFVRELERPALLAAASLLQHGGLTAREHAELFLSERAHSERVLDRLATAGLVELREAPGELFDVNPAIAEPLSRALRGLNALP